MKQSDRLLPIANVSGIMKKTIPHNAKISKDAKIMVQKAASEFIAFVTCKAQDLCKIEKRKTLTGEDLVVAIEQLGMPLHADAGRRVLYKLREGIHCDKDAFQQQASSSVHWKPYYQ